jgi:hypothetical protein
MRRTTTLFALLIALGTGGALLADDPECGFRPRTRAHEPQSTGIFRTSEPQRSFEAFRTPRQDMPVLDLRDRAAPPPRSRDGEEMSELDAQKGCAMWLYSRRLEGDLGVEPAVPAARSATPRPGPSATAGTKR